MVIDHHQLDVLGLILYTSCHMWSLRRNNTVCQFSHKNMKHFSVLNWDFLTSRMISEQHTQQTQRSTHVSCVTRKREKRNDESIRMNFAKLNHVCLFSKFQIKMRAALRTERQTAADVWLCLRNSLYSQGEYFMKKKKKTEGWRAIVWQENEKRVISLQLCKLTENIKAGNKEIRCGLTASRAELPICLTRTQNKRAHHKISKSTWSHTCLFVLLCTTFDPGNGGLGKGGSGRSPKRKRHIHCSHYSCTLPIQNSQAPFSINTNTWKVISILFY